MSDYLKIDYIYKDATQFTKDLEALANSNMYLATQEDGSIIEIDFWEKFCAVVRGWWYGLPDNTSVQAIDLALKNICEANKNIIDKPQLENIFKIAFRMNIIKSRNNLEGQNVQGMSERVHAVAEFLTKYLSEIKGKESRDIERHTVTSITSAVHSAQIQAALVTESNKHPDDHSLPVIPAGLQEEPDEESQSDEKSQGTKEYQNEIPTKIVESENPQPTETLIAEENPLPDPDAVHSAQIQAAMDTESTKPVDDHYLPVIPAGLQEEPDVESQDTKKYQNEIPTKRIESEDPQPTEALIAEVNPLPDPDAVHTAKIQAAMDTESNKPVDDHSLPVNPLGLQEELDEEPQPDEESQGTKEYQNGIPTKIIESEDSQPTEALIAEVNPLSDTDDKQLEMQDIFESRHIKESNEGGWSSTICTAVKVAAAFISIGLAGRYWNSGTIGFGSTKGLSVIPDTSLELNKEMMKQHFITKFPNMIKGRTLVDPYAYFKLQDGDKVGLSRFLEQERTDHLAANKLFNVLITNYPTCRQDPNLPVLIHNVVNAASKDPILKILLQGDYKFELKINRGLSNEDKVTPEGEFLVKALAEVQINSDSAFGDINHIVGLVNPVNIAVHPGNGYIYSVENIKFVIKGLPANQDHKSLYELKKEYSTNELIQMMVPEKLRILHQAQTKLQTVEEELTPSQMDELNRKKLSFLEKFKIEEIENSLIHELKADLKDFFDYNEQLVIKLMILESKNLEFNQVDDLFSVGEVQEALNSQEMSNESRWFLNDWLIIHKQAEALIKSRSLQSDEEFLKKLLDNDNIPKEIISEVQNRVSKDIDKNPTLKTLLKGDYIVTFDWIESNVKDTADYHLVFDIVTNERDINRIVYDNTLETPIEWSTPIYKRLSQGDESYTVGLTGSTKRTIKTIQYVVVNDRSLPRGSFFYKQSQKKTPSPLQPDVTKKNYDHLVAKLKGEIIN